MTWFSAFSRPQRMLRVMTAIVTAASVPSVVSAQTATKPTNGDDKDQQTTVQATQMTGRPDREVFLQCNVEITRGDTTINADKATYDIVDDRVDASGNIRMNRNGDRYTGDTLKFKMDAGQGFVQNPTYHLKQKNAQGQAERIDFLGENQANVVNGTYSTCEGPDPDWYLKTNTMHLDQDRGEGTSGTTVVYFKDVPILGTPYMSFPLSNERKSGVLPPTIGSTSTGGLDITVPYYFNIAPNRDLTLYPDIIARRGLRLGADGRYLGDTYSGETKLEFLPDDHITGTNRYALASVHNQTLAPGWGFAWNYSAASDASYPNDFAHTITNSSQRLLLRDVNTSYGSTYWSAVARVSTYQVLQDPLSPITAPYDRMPQLTLVGTRQDFGGFDWNFNSEFTRFWQPDLVSGDRLFLNPSVAYPIIHTGYFVTPKVSFDVTKYSLENRTDGGPTEITRALPTFSLDSGMVFERDAQFLGQNMTQTLEPRLFYVRTPYRNQNDIPLFDTAVADLSFAQLFNENQFVGHDRISDANQLTAAVVSRYIESSGVERMRFAIGQIFYFSSPQVNIAAPTTGTINRSDLLLSMYGKVNATLDAETNIEYDQNQHTMNRGNVDLRWQPKPKHVFNIEYRKDVPNALEQFDTSAQWPIVNRWYGVARLNYSLLDHAIVEGLGGLEYKADCWVFRVVAQRIPTGTNQTTSALFFQLELNGLTRVGSNPLDTLRASVPGYQLINQP
jgi:LPS-assembly protein